MDSIPEIIVSTSELADIFDVSERQIQRLVKAGVLEPKDEGHIPYKFDLGTVTTQYAVFLQSGISISNWAPDAAII